MDKSLIRETEQMPVLVSPDDIASVLAVKPEGIAINRVTASYRLYYECQNFRPHVVEAVYDRPLENLLQAYHRYHVIGNDWVKLDFGWLPIGVVGEIAIINPSGTRLQRRPTPQQAKELSEQLLFVGIDEKKKHLVVRPKRIQVFERYEFEELWVCASRQITIEVTMAAR